MRRAAQARLGFFPEKKTTHICMACLDQFKARMDLAPIDQFCDDKCKRSFMSGYDLGLKVQREVRVWAKKGYQPTPSIVNGGPVYGSFHGRRM